MSDLLITSEAAKRLDCTAANVRALERAGRLRAIRTESGVRLFKREDVEALAKKRARSKAEVDADRNE